MKKVLFVIATALVMSVAFSSCKDSKSAKDKENAEAADIDDMDDEDEDEDEDDASMAAFDSNAKPADKLLAIMENLTTLLKNTHINSASDVVARKEKAEKN